MISSSNEHSWKKSRDMLEQVARQGELTGYRIPCLLIAAKDELTPYPRTVQDSVKVTQELGIEAFWKTSLFCAHFGNCLIQFIWGFIKCQLLETAADVEERRSFKDAKVLVGSKKERLDIKAALSNSFGFGDHNSSIIFAPYK
ncbi:hypothetical protein S245_020416 [Arachis hypogaea]